MTSSKVLENGTVAKVVPSALSKVSETSVIFAGMVVVPPARGSLPIMTKGKMLPRLGPFSGANAPTKVGRVTRPLMVPPVPLVVETLEIGPWVMASGVGRSGTTFRIVPAVNGRAVVISVGAFRVDLGAIPLTLAS